LYLLISRNRIFNFPFSNFIQVLCRLVMQLIKQIYHFILSSNLFISVGAVCLCIETIQANNSHLAALPFYGFIFFATLTTYNLYYIKSKVYTYAMPLTLIGCIGSMICFWFTEPISFYPLALLVLLSVLYILPVFIRIPKLIFYKGFKVILLAFIWTICTYILPLSLPHISYNSSSMILLGIHRFLFMLILCYHFYIKDEVIWAYRRNYFLLLAGMLILLLGLSFYLSSIFILQAISLSLISYVFYVSKRTQWQYLFAIDGMMYFIPLSMSISSIFVHV